MYVRLDREKQVQVIHSLAEGNSLRGIERMTGIHRDTVMRLGERIGEGCKSIMDQKMKNLPLKNLEIDEFWSFIFRKQGVHGPGGFDHTGDIWTWIAIDTEYKLVPSVYVGMRQRYDAKIFMEDLSSRLSGRVQLTSDGLDCYAGAVEDAFGSEVDYGQIVKSFTPPPDYPPGTRGTSGEVVRVKRTLIHGTPFRFSTSSVEKQNHTARMHVRRAARATNAFSKKLSNYRAAIYLHYVYYNFCKRHTAIRMPPALFAGITRSIWSVADLIEEVEKIHPII